MHQGCMGLPEGMTCASPISGQKNTQASAEFASKNVSEACPHCTTSTLQHAGLPCLPAKLGLVSALAFTVKLCYRAWFALFAKACTVGQPNFLL